MIEQNRRFSWRSVLGALILIVVLCAAYLLSVAVGAERFGSIFGFSPIRLYADGVGTLAHGVGTLFTYAFVHADLAHLLLNAGVILLAGIGIRSALSVRAVILIFALGVVFGAVADLFVFGRSGGVIGASAGACALLAAWLHVRVSDPALLIAGGMLWLLGNYLAGTLWMDPADAIAWEAHTGGFLAGLIAVSIVRRDSHAGV